MRTYGPFLSGRRQGQAGGHDGRMAGRHGPLVGDDRSCHGVGRRRRSHRFFTWAQLGFCLGPLWIPLALSHVRRVRHQKPEVVRRGSVQDSVVDVLVIIDGSRQAIAAVQTFVEGLGERLRRLLIARAVMYDSVIGDPEMGQFERDLVDLDLEQAAASSTDRSKRPYFPEIPPVHWPHSRESRRWV